MTIRLRGVRVHNLKNVSLDIPRGSLVAICGVSGSGKTSLALDTLYAEGQRRYIESFSAYTRQFLERLEKPDFDSIDGLPPALAITRAGAPRGNRSTVGTASETLDYLRLLYATVAKIICHGCGQTVRAASPQSVAESIEQLPKSAKLLLAFTVVWDDAADRAAVLAELQTQGFIRLISDGRLLQLGDDTRETLSNSLPKQGAVLVVTDRLRGGDTIARTSESLESTFEHGFGEISLLIENAARVSPDSLSSDSLSSDSLSSDSQGPLAENALEPLEIDGAVWCKMKLTRAAICHPCQIEYPDPEPRLFSFNSPLGACAKCEGFGDTIDLDMQRIVPDERKSIRQGAIAPWSTPAYEHHLDELIDIADDLKIPVDVPFKKLTKRQVRVLLEGSTEFHYAGLMGFFKWLERKKYKMHVRVYLARWRSYNTCTACGGARLSPEALSYRISGMNLAEACNLQIDELAQRLSKLKLEPRDAIVAASPLEQVTLRLAYLQSVGLGYLQLGRPLRTLSGGEAQRTSLTSALGSSLVNMLYVLDEPSVGLHPHDVGRLATAIGKLKDRDNTVVIVEHEELLLERAEHLIEVGPKAGKQGGEIVFEGSRSELLISDTSLTGAYLTGKKSVPRPGMRRAAKSFLSLTQCTGNNLKGIDADFPLGVLCLVTGVSGSGKSSLVQDTLFGAVKNRIADGTFDTLPFAKVTGTSSLDDCILVDQSPVSRSPRSNPVTYVKAFDEIRRAFANTTDAKIRGMTAGHFSFNSDLGRCPNCSGDGLLQIDMQFLADVQMTCSACNGARYRSEILAVRYRNESIASVLQMTIDESIDFFRGEPKAQQKLHVLRDVGLGYLQLGQSATTLSAGEAQRLKLAGFLASASKKRTLFILDEPTTGLHSHDIAQLLQCFNALLAGGNSLVVVEHNLPLMAAADYLIDLGPQAAEQGGQIVVAGTPEEVALCDASITGQYLRKTLEPHSG